MQTGDERDRQRQAAEIAHFFVQLAEEKPRVLDALHSLLRTLVTPSPSFRESASPLPCRDGEPKGEATGTSTTSGIDRALAEIPSIEQSADAATPERRPRTTSSKPAPPPSAQAQAGLLALAARFGDPSHTSGLGKQHNASLQEAVAFHAPTEPSLDRWGDDVEEARFIARLLRAQTRRLRSIRRAMHSNTPVPPIDHVLANARIDDWTANSANISALAPRQLKEGQRWYELAARAATAVGDWLDEHADASLGYGQTPEPFRDRLHCLAIAQKGVYCWLEEALGPSGRCGVQRRVMETLKSWVARDYFAVFLPSGMVLAQRITSDEREELTRKLQRFELEHATPDAPTQLHTTVARSIAEPVTTTTTSTEPQECAVQLETVHDAFLAAKGEFTDGSIVFTDRAEESAEESAFKRPQEVLDLFRAMHAIAHALTTGQLEGTPLATVFAERGFKSKLSSEHTMRRYHRFYHMTFEGREVDLSVHVTLGSRNQNTCISVHWWYDTARRRFVIGHCGKHLPNTRT